MHYGNKAFGNGKVTLQAIGDPSRVLGQRNGLSDLDVQEIKALYRCQGTFSVFFKNSVKND